MNAEDAGAVLVGYLHPNTVSHSFAQSLTRLLAFDIGHEQRLARAGGPAMMRCGPGSLVEARNELIRHFLDENTAEWLFIVDTDMGFAPDTVERLVEVADPVDRPVVGGLAFSLHEVPDGMGGWRTEPRPTIYDWAEKPDGEFGFGIRGSYSVGALTRCAGTGAACLLVHRSAAEKVRGEHGDVWFQRVTYPVSGLLVSEDLSFCYRLGTVGVPVHVHCGVKTTHHKAVWLAEQDYWAAQTVPPATEQVAVVVPVMRRPQNAKPFARSLIASSGLASIYVVADEGDTETQAAWSSELRLSDGSGPQFGPEDQIISVNGARPGTFAEKVNRGAKAVWEPWLFIVGDDVTFRPGWLDHALHVANTSGAAVVGTNDLGTPLVQAGEHATHLLIRRDYVDEVGASWDGPGVLAHEGYGHWFVDNEIVTAAKQRNTWAMALGSVVEHRHPMFGKAEDDEVYQLGFSRSKADQELWEKRCATYL